MPKLNTGLRFNKMIAALVLLTMASCAHDIPNTEAPTIERITFSLSELPSDPRLTQTAPDRYQITLGPDAEVKIFRFAFQNQKELKAYLLNRRLLLHRDFQDHIAPYTGMMEANQHCVQSADVKAQLQKRPDGEFFYMDFPVTNSKIISDCLKDDVWGMIRYTFYNCKKKNELFETRYIKSLSAKNTEIKLICGAN